jgi:nucleotide sugar dehydrogenase
MKISIVGFGYIGAVIGAVYAELGHSVHAIDSNVSSMNDLNQGICHVPEPALRELIKKGVENKNLSGSTSYDSVLGSDVVLVTVGTPLSDEFDADLSAIRDVFKKLSGYVSDGQIIMVKSTVPPGVTRQMADEFLANRENVFIGFSPERLAEGNAIHELKTLPIVVGGVNSESTRKCAEFWKKTLEVEVIEVSTCEAAELVKLANNQWIDLNIALANELAILCDSLPYDLDVLEIIQGANSLKKGQHYVNILTPSIGVGGYCLTKDPWFLSALGAKHGASIYLPQTGRKVNDKMPHYSADSISRYFKGNNRPLSSLKVAILGYSFKSNSGDVRFSPMEKFVEYMFDANVLNINVFDSTISEAAINDSRVVRSNTWEECIKDADCVVFGAAHDDLCRISMKEIAQYMAEGGLLYDGRRFLSKIQILELQKLGITYQGVGRSFS